VALLTVRLYGDPVLRQVATPVREITAEITRIIADMTETMWHQVGIGLAAPQVGVQKRFFTYDVGEGPQVIFNPEVVDTEGEWTYEEGCLSIPGFHFEIVRPKLVTIAGIDIDGDASIRMNLGELETVTTYELPVKVVVLNNCGDGMVKQWQKLFYKGRLSASDKSLHKKDFVKAALADGFKYAHRLDVKADVPRVIEEFIRFKGPAFLEVMIDPDAGVYPMVGPGQAYDEMITGDHIPSRTTVKIQAPDASEMF